MKDGLEKLRPYFTQNGWVLSREKCAPQTASGEPLPWLTYPAIRFLEPRIRKTLTVFEWGSGNSTRWWSSRVRVIASCEHNKGWYDRMKGLSVVGKIGFSFRPLTDRDAYCHAIAETEWQFDVAVIDGRERVNCSRWAVHHLSGEGVIIWDNTERERYSQGLNNLESIGFRRLDFWGLGPINTDEWCTSIFYRNNNCLRI